MSTIKEMTRWICKNQHNKLDIYSGVYKWHQIKFRIVLHVQDSCLELVKDNYDYFLEPYVGRVCTHTMYSADPVSTGAELKRTLKYLVIMRDNGWLMD